MKKKTELSCSTDPVRRRLLGWMGIGILGTLVIKTIPFKFVSKKATRKNRTYEKVKVSINDLAVRRNPKVISNV
ncbi:MAG: hypothetical protein WAO19_13650 [Candidatus Kryptoniota bacterium]